MPKKSIVEKFGAQRFSNPLFISLLLAVATLIVYWPVSHCDFVSYDDPSYYSNNPHVLGGLTGGNIAWAFSTIDPDAPTWHPLTWLSLMLDAEIFGNNPAGPHLTNLLFHVANVILLFVLLRQITKRFWPPAVVAALFALHPQHVESVAWISERKDVLSVFFGLLSLIFYALFAKKFKGQNSESKVFYALALAVFAAGLMSKPLLVTLPFVMLLFDFWPLQRFDNFKIKFLLAEKIPFFILSAMDCIVTFFAQQKAHAVAAVTQLPIGLRIENIFVSYARYLEKTFWPFSLANPYPYPGRWPVGLVIFCVMLFLVCSAAAILARKYPFAFVGWFWFIGTLVPMIGLVQVGSAAMADRYTYLPTIGVFIVLAWGGVIVFEKAKFFRPLIVMLTLAVLTGLSVRTRNQLRYWQNDGTLFSHTLAVTKNNYVAQINYGAWLAKNGNTVEALNYYYQALQLATNDATALFNIGNAFEKLGNWDEAIRDYRHALAVAPNQPDVLNNLGLALARENQFAEARTNFEAALKINPDFSDAHNNLAAILFRQGNYEEAAREFFEAAKLEPDNPRIFISLGQTFIRLGKTNVAVQCFQQALQLEPDNQKLREQLTGSGIKQ